MTVYKEINYRLLDVCCARCENSYYNTYGDMCCNKLKPTDLINGGGVCDFFTKEQAQITEPIIQGAIEEVQESGSCVDCVHSYMNKDSPMCDIDETLIENINGRCNAYEQAEL